jgi:hypothetical protein
LIAFCKEHKTLPREVREKKEVLKNFQHFIRQQGIETDWP